MARTEPSAEALAADYDLVINVGRVMGPETNYDAVANVGINGQDGGRCRFPCHPCFAPA